MRLILQKLILFLLVACAAAPALAQAARTDQGWPRKIVRGANSFALYQPQIEQWQGNRLEARAAIAITDGQSQQTAYGVLWFTARTEIDKLNRLVLMADFRITRVSFPAAADRAGLYEQLIRQQVPQSVEVIALDRLLADLATQAEKPATGHQLKNEPPRIFFSTRPAVLVLIDGEPALRSITGTTFKRVINTRALIFADEAAGKFYLRLMDGWMEAPAVIGPWAVAARVPAGLNQAMAAAETGRKEMAKTGDVTTVYVSLGSAALLQTQGEPQVAAIEGTRLIYVANTDDDIFVDTATQDHYVLLAGRWFRAKSMNGPWEFVPGGQLTADFARIPATHAKANVLASVPGTPQAKDALVANDVPQTATVTRSEAKLAVAYDGQPQFKPIEGTTLTYAVNTPTPVIAVGASSYYAVENGVWFVASAPAGPWLVATSVPPDIYTIPPSSPVHNVTYVKVYGSTPRVVYVGYTPGYYGAVVSSDNVVVYGTGWRYPAYAGTAWYGGAYGYGCAYGGVYSGVNTATGTRYYGRGGTSTNLYTGMTVSGAGGVAYNPYTGRVSAGQAGAATNAYTGNAAAGARGVTYNPQTGVISGGAAGATYNAATGQVTAVGGGFAYNTKTGTGVAVGNNNVYAGKDGNVYRYNQSTGLQQHTSDGWSAVNRPADTQSMQSQRAARDVGQQRWDSVRSSGNRPARHGGFAGGVNRPHFSGRRR